MKKITLIGFILASFFFNACSNKNKDPFQSLSIEDKNKLAKEYYSKANTFNQGSAIQQKYLDSSLMADPTYSESLFEKSVWFTKIGDLEKGQNLLGKAVGIDPEIHLGYYAWAQLYIYHDYEGAIVSIEELSSIYPDVTQYPSSENQHIITANAYRQLKEYKQAIRYYNKCVVIEGKDGLDWVNPYVFVYRALCWHDLKQYDRAIKDFELVLSMHESCADAYFYKAKTLEKLDQKNEALQNYKLALKHKAYLKKGYYSRDFDPVYTANIVDAMANLNE